MSGERCGYEWEPEPGEVTPCGTTVACEHQCRLDAGHAEPHWCCDTFVGEDWTPAYRPPALGASR